MADIEQLGVNVIRGIAMDGPQKANSGHPGTAMALAPLAHVLFTRVLRHDPAAPEWPDRDRFILSAGHASILLYSMLHLCGYGVERDDLLAFRQWGSRTPGHPEAGHTPGVEVTTGPLGQGFANGVGMAIAERWLRSRFGPELFDHHVFAICGDGDLHEGISHEAASLAGHLGLGRLVYVFDDNHITIDGGTDLSCSDDVARRFESYGWHVERLGDVANDLDALEAGLRRGMAEQGRPSLLILRSHIGWPSPGRTDTSSAHGSPFGAEEIARTKEILGLPDEAFWVPAEVEAWYRERAGRGRAARLAWEGRLASYDGDRAALEACLAGRGVAGWEAKLPVWSPGEKVATRAAIRSCVNATADVVPGVLAGGADLTENVGLDLAGAQRQSAEWPGGRQVYFGIREHAMGAALVGAARHGGVLPVGGTFFVFADYMRGAVRLAALSGAKCVFVWTHDSVGVGEDGPTHQPVEHLASLRAMPGLRLLRPADANETAAAWRVAVEADGPTALVLTRQAVPVLEGTSAEGVAHGAYVLAGHEGGAGPQVVLLGTGSEVHLCVAAAEQLAAEGITARVVSMPSWDLFAARPPAERRAVLPQGTPVLAVEAASSFGWERWADATIGIDRFGASAPGNTVMAELGFTVENIVAHARALVVTP